MPGLRLMLSTAPRDIAPGLARALVEERLAACVNVVEGARSIYVWKGAVCDEGESLLFIKTTEERAKDIGARLKTLHPYEVPELISLEIRPGEGNPDYLSWLAAACGASPQS